MKILHLTLKKKWFEMILSGEKKEEYREIKPYWTKRLIYGRRGGYDAIKFTNGYGNDKPSFIIELKGIYRTLGIEKWGAPLGETVYVLRLGDIIETKNIKP